MSTCWPFWACYYYFNQYEVEWFMQRSSLGGRGVMMAMMTMKTKLKVPREKECQWKQEIKEVTGSNGFF
ncbi:hypothetical protein M6B38_349840 [Iris pallida]|uniref:Uncharacterized protein n=1 Tax=Iris pallida TaxID=29817 RepID=A0AAX6GS91_IRIPA|nr:hypothetical protein M6B38_349840 [Iris pallida]